MQKSEGDWITQRPITHLQTLSDSPSLTQHERLSRGFANTL